MGKIINHKGHHGGRYDDPHGVTAPTEQSDWRTIPYESWGPSHDFERAHLDADSYCPHCEKYADMRTAQNTRQSQENITLGRFGIQPRGQK